MLSTKQPPATVESKWRYHCQQNLDLRLNFEGRFSNDKNNNKSGTRYTSSPLTWFRRSFHNFIFVAGRICWFLSNGPKGDNFLWNKEGLCSYVFLAALPPSLLSVSKRLPKGFFRSRTLSLVKPFPNQMLAWHSGVSICKRFFNQIIIIRECWDINTKTLTIFFFPNFIYLLFFSKSPFSP